MFLNELPQRFGGFYTEEIRDHGIRVGFKVVALEGGETYSPTSISQRLNVLESMD